jgi:arylsulfate sulfotransferase
VSTVNCHEQPAKFGQGSFVRQVDYRNGQGQGNILWRLGEDGEFQLVNGSDPGDWFDEQHSQGF